MAPPAQLGPTRTFQVLFPPHKVLLATDFSARTGSVSEWRIAAACVDAHAEVVPRSRALPQYHLGDGGPPWSIDVASTQSMLHTIDGVRGRDIE
ncbi:MAG: hypothetical protein DYG92_02900 [Leptolyngbya sp. PLA1]|nr:hypothetical protein [Leptolyngbya sp. PLA1]